MSSPTLERPLPSPRFEIVFPDATPIPEALSRDPQLPYPKAITALCLAISLVAHLALMPVRFR